MSTAAVEHLLARLYTDAGLRERFLDDPQAVLDAQDGTLTDDERASLERMDADGLVLAARSYTTKRERRRESGKPGWWARMGFGSR